MTELKRTSQYGQDEFAWLMLEKKSNGTCLDIGSGWPQRDSNSAGLERIGWSCICIDSGKDGTSEDPGWRERAHMPVIDDATAHDYSYLAEKHMDYLSLDVDESSAEALAQLLRTARGTTFSVITIEHDEYRFGPEIRERERSMLTMAGYDLLCPAVYPEDQWRSIVWEDWWVRPGWVSEGRCELVRGMRDASLIIDALRVFPF